MASWFTKRTTVDPSDPGAQLGAYKEGRRDERLQTEAGVPDHRFAKAELDEAYDRGRRDGRSRRRGSPLITILLLLLASVGILTIILAVRYGSFAAAGEAVDTAISSITQPAAAPVRN